MNRRWLAWVCLGTLVVVSPLRAFAASTLDHEFVLDSKRVVLQEIDGKTQIRVRGAHIEVAEGRPELPWIGERLEVPAGFRVSGVRVLGIDASPLAERVQVPSTLKGRPGLGPFERTAPDPAYFSRSGFQPEAAVRIGYQGFLRGNNVACLEICPVRWDAASGRLESVERVRVRLDLEPTTDAPLRRERVVPEWESSPAAVASARGAVVSSEAAARQPGRVPFRATQLPSLLGSPVQYVIITNETMAPEFQRLADWKTQTGVPAVVRTLSFIQQEYPSGSDDAERIRLFIRDAYARWGTKWVLLGGDTDVLPTRYAHNSYYGGEEIAADLYFSCLDGNWNGDGDAVYGEGVIIDDPSEPNDAIDLLPEVWVGRAPTVSLAEAQRFVDKTLQYIRQPAGDYERRVLFFAEVLFPQNWVYPQATSLDGAEIVEDLLPFIQSNPSIHYARLYQNHTFGGYQPGAVQETHAAVIDSLNIGYNVASHVGHGFRNVMSVADGNLTNEDALALTNGNRLINLYASNCTSNAIDFPCIGEAFLHAPNGGAVTNIGSSRFDFPVVGRYFEEEYFRLLYEDSTTAVGEAQAMQKVPFASYSVMDNMYRWTTQTLLLLGDPELRIYTGTPRILTVTHLGSRSLSDTTLAVNVKIGGVDLMGARVTAYKADDEFRTALTDGAGNVTLKLRPDQIGPVTLTVTGFDCKPYQATVNITAATGPVIADLAAAVDDDTFNGTIGNGNGMLDAGETADILVPLRNVGISSAPSVVGTLSTTDGMITVVVPTVNYGLIGVGLTSSPTAYRVSIPYTVTDQREVPFKLSWVDGAARYGSEEFQLVVSAPEVRQLSHTVADGGGGGGSGNANGIVEVGETIHSQVRLWNSGTGEARTVTGKLRCYDGFITVSDSTASWDDLAPGEEVLGDAFVFVPSNTAGLLELRVSDSDGLMFVQKLDLVAPSAPDGLYGDGFESSVHLGWTPSPSADLLGYNVYRSLASIGPYTRVNTSPTNRTAYYLDSPLSPMTTYFFQVTAVDSSGNESPRSASFEVRTSLPLHTVFPITMGGSTPSSVALDPIYGQDALDIVVGANVLYVWHADGTAPVDADGAGATSGDFTTRGYYYAAPPSIADLDGDGLKEIIGPNWNPTDTARVFVFDQAGQVKPGWPVAVNDSIWSGAAIGDVDNDGKKEMFFGTFGTEFYGFRFNGTEVINGDSNPATTGVFKTLFNSFNLGTPALADLDANGALDIIYASFDFRLYAWRANGTNLPGFPVILPEAMTASVAVGYLDGPGDNELDIVVQTGQYSYTGATDSLYVFRANGQRRAGWPVHLAASRSGRSPSPALADMNNDGFLDIVQASTSGLMHVYNRNGTTLAPVHGTRYSELTNGASESSPVVADINGDGLNDIVMGDELGRLTALSGAGGILPGFPIQLDAEVKGTPGLCDCDRDGLSEIVVAGWDRNLYVWDYDFPFSPGKVPPWPQFHHDAMRTGLASNMPFVGVDDPAGAPAAIEFAAPRPNPARTRSRIAFAVPDDRAGAKLELAVFDLSGRRVQTLASGPASAGRHSVEWNLRDQGGNAVGAGVYFLKLALGSDVMSRKLVVMK